VKKQLDSYFTKEGIDATVMDWQESAGAIGTLSSAVKIVFNVLVLIIAIVAIIIIIMNTIVISVTERVPEIGTMRAVGAKKGFIFRLILTEVMIIVLVFGLIGIGLGASLLVVLNLTGIEAANMFFEIIFGGKVLHPVLSGQAMAMALDVIGSIGILASLYPIAIALRIQPVRAIAQE
jgi:putative ABC transport system permease protein